MEGLMSLLDGGSLGETAAGSMTVDVVYDMLSCTQARRLAKRPRAQDSTKLASIRP